MGDEQQSEEAGIGMDDVEAWQLIDSSSAFPPNHHEGLPLVPLPLPPSSSSSPPSPPPLMEVEEEEEDDDDDDDDERSSSIIRRAMSGAAARLSACVCLGFRFWKVASVVGVAALALVYMKKKMQRWRPLKKKKKGTAGVVVEEDKVSRLILLIKDRDQRINQLLLQIAQMNQLLLTRRTVPVLRVASYN